MKADFELTLDKPYTGIYHFLSNFCSQVIESESVCLVSELFNLKCKIETSAR